MKNVIDAIRQTSRVLCESRRIAADLRAKADKPIRTKNIARECEIRNNNWRLREKADKVEARGERVWGAVLSYQGKYINWKDNHEVNGIKLCGTGELISYALFNKMP